MAQVKEDGSLNIEGINNLPIEQYMSEIGSLSKEQYEEYCNAQRTDEPDYPAFAIQSSCPMEEDGVDALEFLQRMKEKYKNNSKDNFGELVDSFHEDYEIMNAQVAMNRQQGKPEDSDMVSIEEFRQAGIDEINRLYGKKQD